MLIIANDITIRLPLFNRVGLPLWRLGQARIGFACVVIFKLKRSDSCLSTYVMAGSLGPSSCLLVCCVGVGP